ncbi:hypothetical protein Hanom_Chr09g00870701 [Helianthus anomalus]
MVHLKEFNDLTGDHHYQKLLSNPPFPHKSIFYTNKIINITAQMTYFLLILSPHMYGQIQCPKHQLSNS